MSKRRVLADILFANGPVAQMSGEDIQSFLQSRLSKSTDDEVKVMVCYGHLKECQYCCWQGHVPGSYLTCPNCHRVNALKLLAPRYDGDKNVIAWAGLTPRANNLVREITRQTGREAAEEVERALELYSSFVNLAEEMTIQERSKNVAG
jgi:hypothetical protein